MAGCDGVELSFPTLVWLAGDSSSRGASLRAVRFVRASRARSLGYHGQHLVDQGILLARSRPRHMPMRVTQPMRVRRHFLTDYRGLLVIPNPSAVPAASMKRFRHDQAVDACRAWFQMNERSDAQGC